MPSKLPYNERVECRKHEGEIAAVCSRCYDAALTQQDRQVQREREQAHTLYLSRRRSGVAFLGNTPELNAELKQLLTQVKEIA